MLFIRSHTIRIKKVFPLYETWKTNDCSAMLSLSELQTYLHRTIIMHRYVRHGNDRTGRFHVSARSVVSIDCRYPPQLV